MSIFKILAVTGIKQIVGKFVNAPVSNAFVEHIFSLIESTCGNDRSI